MKFSMTGQEKGDLYNMWLLNRGDLLPVKLSTKILYNHQNKEATFFIP